MTNKNVLIVLVVAVIIVGGLFLNGSLNSNSSGTNSTLGTTVGGEQINLTTEPNPLKPGSANFIIEVKDKNSKPVNDAKVFFDLNMTTMNMGAQKGNANSQGDGRYTAEGRLSMRGPWRVATKVTMSDGNVVNKDFTVNVP